MAVQYYTYSHDAQVEASHAGGTVNFAKGKGYYVVYPAATKPTYAAGNPSSPAATTPDYYSAGGDGQDTPAAPSSPAAPKPPVIDEPTDWASYLGLFGLDDEAIAAINSVKRTGNLSIDVANILNAVRQTQWYARTYPGIGEAIAKGIVTNESDYRQKQNEFDQVFQQNYGRAITPSEYAEFLKQGLSADIVNRQIQGDRYVQANKNDIQYAEGNFGDAGQFTGQQLQDIGRNKAGLGTPNGVNLQAQLDKAIARAQRVFQGTLAGMTVNPTNQTGAPAPGNQTADVGR